MVNVRDYKFIYMDHKIYGFRTLYYYVKYNKKVYVQKKKKDNTAIFTSNLHILERVSVVFDII